KTSGDVPIHVDARDAMATRFQCVGDAVAAHQRNRPFVGPPAHQDGNMELGQAHRGPHGRPTLWISHSRFTPWLSATRRRTSSPRPSISALVARPVLMRKFACFSLTCASP